MPVFDVNRCLEASGKNNANNDRFTVLL